MKYSLHHYSLVRCGWPQMASLVQAGPLVKLPSQKQFSSDGEGVWPSVTIGQAALHIRHVVTSHYTLHMFFWPILWLVRWSHVERNIAIITTSIGTTNSAHCNSHQDKICKTCFLLFALSYEQLWASNAAIQNKQVLADPSKSVIWQLYGATQLKRSIWITGEISLLSFSFASF